MQQYVLLVKAPDETGLVYKITSLLFQKSLNIEKNDEYVDKETNKFFMRTLFTGEVSQKELHREVVAVLPKASEVRLDVVRPKKIILMATKESHCLGDILIRYDSGEFPADIQAVVSNYENLRKLTERFEIPFHDISHEGLEREEHEEKLLEVIRFYEPDFVVLAKYMRILTPKFVSAYPNQIVNIHHSFLPAFIGANPYKQAHERGVKIIGATAHFVNEDLDEGPIIEQDVEHVDHSYGWREMQKVGRDIEKIVLSRALNLVLEDRVFVHSNKTVIF